jgi:hypothetical protein
MKNVQKEWGKIRRRYAVIEGHMCKLVRLGRDQEKTYQVIAGELQRQARLLEESGVRIKQSA